MKLLALALMPLLSARPAPVAPRATGALARAADKLRIKVSGLPAGTQAAEVELALTETGLASQVGRGENAGRLLHHAAVVRSLRPVGTDGTFTAPAPST